MVQRSGEVKKSLLGLLSGVLCLSGIGLARVNAQPPVAPAVTYSSAMNTIFIGSNSGAPAGSQTISVPGLATALAGVGFADLVVDQGAGAWLIKANVTISATGRLDATNATLTELRLDSPPVNALKITAKRGGQLLIDRIKVLAWEAGAVDTNITNQRSYLLALEGGRMDILNSDVGYLGWADGEPSGLSWRKRLSSGNPTTGATGSIKDSFIHDNYFGMYAYEAYGLQILRNEVHHNISYGIDPHDGSRAFEVAFNKVYSNGKHGIIFSRECVENSIHDNEVYSNAQHGIMMDRGSNNNQIFNNVVYQNQDGISAFQSSNNLIQNNFVHHNVTGVRINATVDIGDPFDAVSTGNQVLNNRIEDNSEQGVYLYARADRNTIADNQILRSGFNGIYIKSGGNLIRNNVIREANVGINIAGGEYMSDTTTWLDVPATNNIIIGTTLAANRDTGIRVSGGKNNRIGPLNAGETANVIETNGTDGIVINIASNGAVATGNQVLGNTIRNNTRHGVSIKAVSSVQNRLSRNSITGNVQSGIRIEDGAQQGITPPVVTRVQGEVVTGTAVSGAIVEVYSDPAGEGQTYFGTTNANASGEWTFTLPAGADIGRVTALAIDLSGNTSQFLGAVPAATYLVDTDTRGQTRIRITGNGAEVTLPMIKARLGTTTTQLLQNLGNGIWLLNANLFIDIGVTLNLSPLNGVKELRLRSQASTQGGGGQGMASRTILEPDGQSAVLAIDYGSFVNLTTHSGVINVDGVKIYSWDPTRNAVDEDVANGRAYILAKYDAALNIDTSDIGYLGSADGESYGISWRDINATITSTVLRSRVTGEVLNSKIHHNYYGIYTFQASNMLFRGNEVYNNLRYGFDPHDFTHDVLIENNVAHHNGSHGFIISRGCNNFTFRNNISHSNLDPGTSQAHGFMLDPGSPNSTDPQAPSYENILDTNEAYGNEGYGLRILGSVDNQVLNNNFHNNEQGIVVDTNSPDNLISNNSLNQNTLYGLVLGGTISATANRTTVLSNTLNSNGNHGIYVRSNTNLISGNTSSLNQGSGIALLPATGAPLLVDNEIISNTLVGNVVNILTNNPGNGLDMRGATHTLVQDNVIESNNGSGIYVANSSKENAFIHNLIRANKNLGILASGNQTIGNTWSENQIFSNTLNGITLASGANQNLAAPQLMTATYNMVSGVTSPSLTVEIYADQGAQGQFFLGRTTADALGNFSFALSGTRMATNLTALVIDVRGNASPFSTAVGNPDPPMPTPTPTSTSTSTPTPTSTSTSTSTPTPTATPVTPGVPSVTPPPATTTPTATPVTPGVPSVTPTSTPTATPVTPGVPSVTPTATPTATPVTPGVPSVTPTATPTATPVTPGVPSVTPTATPVTPGVPSVTPSPSATLMTPVGPGVTPGTLPGNNRMFLPLITR